jgi:predicted NBD/HSP70 family sugar kinase
MGKLVNNAASVRIQNTALVKLMICKFKGISRKEIAEKLFLSPPAITSIINEISTDGVIVENDRTVSADNCMLGRHQKGLSFIDGQKYVIGIETSPLGLVFCICSFNGTILLEKIVEDGYFEVVDFLNVIEKTCNDFANQLSINLNQIIGICIGVAGRVDEEKGIIIRCFIKEWNNLNVVELLEKRLPIPVTIINNVKARAFAEDLKETQIDNSDSFCYFFAARGTSCPYVYRRPSDIRPFVTAGELGHFKFDHRKQICPICGKKGCLDANANEQVMQKEIEKELCNHPESRIAAIYREKKAIDIFDIIEARKAGDSWMDPIFEDSLKLLALALSNLINLLMPKRVYVDSKIITELNFRDYFEKKVKEDVFGNEVLDIQFIFIQFDRYRGAQAAALYAFRKFYIEKGLKYEDL